MDDEQVVARECFAQHVRIVGRDIAAVDTGDFRSEGGVEASDGYGHGRLSPKE
jgi:hypothetical protein